MSWPSCCFKHNLSASHYQWLLLFHTSLKVDCSFSSFFLTITRMTKVTKSKLASCTRCSQSVIISLLLTCTAPYRSTVSQTSQPPNPHTLAQTQEQSGWRAFPQFAIQNTCDLVNMLHLSTRMNSRTKTAFKNVTMQQRYPNFLNQHHHMHKTNTASSHQLLLLAQSKSPPENHLLPFYCVGYKFTKSVLF